MLDQNRVDAEIKRQRDSVNLSLARDDVSHAIGKIERFMSGNAPNAIGAGSAFDTIAHDKRFSLIVASDPAERGLTLAYMLSLQLLNADLVRKARGSAVKIGNKYGFATVMGMAVPRWHAAGWTAWAEDFAADIWTDYRARNSDTLNLTLFGNPSPGAWVNDHANPYMVNKAAWFTTMTNVDPGLWRGAGYDPDADSLGPYWMLAQVWDDPDPDRVRNALQAVRDLNLGTTFIKDNPEGKRVYLVDEFLLLDDYDIRAVNMRRIARGLGPVEVESYLPDPLPNAVLPFAQDDVFWPAYLKMCADIGSPPIAPDHPVAVRLDPATLRVTRV